ncbi:MAG: HAD family hydrolase, partial [Clostridia bacterium]
FTPDAIVTYQDVQAAQAALGDTMPGITLTKPHPYMFLKGVFGNAVSDADLAAGRFDPAPCAKTLVIGDAACDLFAAKQAGCDFAAVLTGIDGENARDFFKQEKADYILHNILELLES